ncbi:MAG TPA: hypothetical protein VKQ11_02705 [Candidatus Sulfotelmatobacter sp.]|nr:hypothetical protein [Candidatus Sulfotelmatobacter sp.]
MNQLPPNPQSGPHESHENKESGRHPERSRLSGEPKDLLLVNAPFTRRWLLRPQIWIELFAILNVGFLTFDIYLAHSVNQFRNHAEYIPLFFSAIAPLVLILALALRYRWPEVWKDLGYLVAWVAVLVGLTGVILHLESRFFYERTLGSLTYSAPFAAPLAYTGLGLLVIMNRMVDPESEEWAQWVLLLALGGFVGNFVFSLADHAGNGFFNPLEWVPVVASAIAVGFLFVPLVMRVSRQFIDLCAAVLVLEAGVGLWGFVLHASANLRGPSVHAFDNFIYGAPPMAPLLFPNLMILGIIALWQLRTSTVAEPAHA